MVWIPVSAFAGIDPEGIPRIARSYVAAYDEGRRAYEPDADPQVVRDLVSLLLRATRHASQRSRATAVDYLQRKGLMPSPLRDGGAT